METREERKKEARGEEGKSARREKGVFGLKGFLFHSRRYSGCNIVSAEPTLPAYIPSVVRTGQATVPLMLALPLSVRNTIIAR